MKSHFVRISRVAISDDDDEEDEQVPWPCSFCKKMDDQCICASDLDWFLAQEFVRSYHIKQSGFSKFYVRKCVWAPPGHRKKPTIELANIAATQTGQGTLTRLLADLLRRYPHCYLVAECVLTERLEAGLRRRGFRLVPKRQTTYYLPHPRHAPPLVHRCRECQRDFDPSERSTTCPHPRLVTLPRGVVLRINPISVE